MLAWKRQVLGAVCLAMVAIQTVAGADALLTGDTFITTANAAANFGTNANLAVGNGSTALLQFSLSTLPPGLQPGNVSKAVLRVYTNRVTVGGNLLVSGLTSPLNETAATQAGFGGAIGAVVGGPIPLTSAGTFVSVDVTGSVQSALLTGTVGFALTGDGTLVAQFDAKENTATSQPARLDVTLVSAGPAGATGAPGTPGPVGATGLAGPSGPAGVTGPAGSTGVAGPIGPAGVTGPAGSTGVAGPIGTTGVAGPSGPAGVTGPAGSTGVAGPIGATGVAGPSGPAGVTGPAGSTGVAGPIGATGVAGPAGATGAAGATGVGLPGVAGATGPAGATGVAGPAGAGVRDGNNNVIGTLVSFSTSTLLVARNGYVFGIDVNGVFDVPSLSVYFTGANCTGTGYVVSSVVGEIRFARALIYKPFANRLFQSVPGSNGVSTAVSLTGVTLNSRENAQGQCIAGSAQTAGWEMQTVAPSALGLTYTSTNPPAVQSPLTIP